MQLTQVQEQRTERARRILDECLPRIKDEDQAIDNLYYVDPNANDTVRRWSIASALYVLGLYRRDS